jgi:hypothetical protein
MKPIRYDELVLGKVYIIKKDGIVYKGTYYMHYLKYHDGKDPLTFIDVTPINKKMMDFMPSDEYFMES